MFKRVVMILVLALFLAAGVPSAQAASGTASVYVVHGINGVDLDASMSLPVDIMVSGVGCALKGFTFRQVAGPLALPAGSYNISISLANAASPCSNAAVISGSASVMAGKSYSLVAHLTAAGAPTLSAFVNDLSRARGATGRLSLAHTAAAPAVDVRITGLFSPTTLLEDVVNGQSAALNVRPNFYNIRINPANTATTVFNRWVFVRPGTATFGFVVGSVKNGLFLAGFTAPIR